MEFDLSEPPLRPWVCLGTPTPQAQSSGDEGEALLDGFVWHVNTVDFSGDEVETGGATPGAEDKDETPSEHEGDHGPELEAPVPEDVVRKPPAKARRQRTVPVVELLGVPNKRGRRRPRRAGPGPSAEAVEPDNTVPEALEEEEQPEQKQPRRSARVAQRKALDLD